MLTATELARGRTSRRPPPSLKQQYQEYRLQRIEEYKNGLTRSELLALGDEAAGELQSGTTGQFVLTEILMLETVDRVIAKRLRLPAYTKWRNQILAVRRAQREPIHWSIDPANALVGLLPRLEVDDQVLAIGAGIRAEVMLLAAHEVSVTFVDEDLNVVEQLEARMAAESLSGRFMAFVASLGQWLPPLCLPAHLVLLDAGTLAALPYARRHALLEATQHVTALAGVHVILPGDGPAAPEAYVSHYPAWEREAVGSDRRGKAAKSRGVVLRKGEKGEKG